jgi:hypothetical protein
MALSDHRLVVVAALTTEVIGIHALFVRFLPGGHA